MVTAETRVLYSADPIGAALLPSDAMGLAHVPLVDVEPVAVGAASDAAREVAAPRWRAPPAPPSPEPTHAQVQSVRHELVIVDAGIADADTLVQSLARRAPAGTVLSFVKLQAGVDPLQAIADALARGPQGAPTGAPTDASGAPFRWDALHVVSHGQAGALQLGGMQVDVARLEADADAVRAWRDALSADADVLLYGCRTGADVRGLAFVRALADATGADVAANRDVTGGVAGAGDWSLDVQVGAIESAGLAAADWSGTLGLAPQGAGETGVNTTTPGDQVTVDASSQSGSKSVAVRSDGSYVVVYCDATNQDVYFRRYSAAGVALAGPTLVGNAAAADSDPAIAMDAAGSFVISWTSSAAAGDASGTGILAQRFDAAGTAIDAGPIRVNTAMAGDQAASSVAMSADGWFAVAFQDVATSDIYLQAYDAAGVAQNGAANVRANLTTAGTQSEPTIGMDDAHNVVVAWTSNGQDATASDGVYARRFSAAGVAQALDGDTNDVRVNTTLRGAQNHAQVAVNGDGRFAVAWASGSGATGTSVMLQWFTTTMHDGGELRIDTVAATRVEGVALGIDRTTGRAVAGWTAVNADRDVHAVEVTRSGAYGAAVRLNATTEGDQYGVGIGVGGGQAVAAWTGPGAASDVWVRRASLTDATTITVTTNADNADGNTSSIAALKASPGADGKISLREALIAANNTPNAGGPDTITFAIAGTGAHAILLGSKLPDITGAVIIDGTTDDSYAVNGNRPAIVIDGNDLNASGLVLQAGASGSTIRGLSIRNLGGWDISGILVQAGSHRNVIAGNYVGGIATTGGAAAASLQNAGDGINVIDGSDNIIGGTLAADRNVVGGNGLAGIYIRNPGASHNQVLGNYVGTDATGKTAVSNGGWGVIVDYLATDNFVGGSTPGAGNVISGNTVKGAYDGVGGIFLYAQGVTIQGNKIGIGADGTTLLGNGNSVSTQTSGIFVGSSTDVLIGGTRDAEGNVITNNVGPGIASKVDGYFVSLGNSIYANLNGMAIDLAYDGVNANDALDADAGSNNLQNTPVLTGVMAQPGLLEITGTLSSLANTSFRIEYFIKGALAGDVRTRIAWQDVTTDGSGQAVVDLNIVGGSRTWTLGEIVNATATRIVSPGVLADTSELSANATLVRPIVITSNGGGSPASVSRPENQTAVTTVTATNPNAGTLVFTILGGADAAKFTLGASNGTLAFVAAPDFEAPGDADANNVYDVVVRVTDGKGPREDQVLAVTVADANEPPVITSNGGAATATVSIAENTSAVTTVSAVDPDAGTTLVYAISGGADAARFTIDGATGALRFAAPPNFEAPVDAGANNVYDVIVRVSDGTNADTQAIAVTVTNANDAPTITSNGAGPSASVSVAENGTAVTVVTASDVDAATTLTYGIVGGADAARFTIDAGTGALTFVTAPNFEAAGDAGADNVYDVIVQASDGSLADTQAIAVTVADVNEAPAITSNGAGACAAVTVLENDTSVTTVAAADADAGTSLTYTVTGGADAAAFAIDAVTGVLTFRTAPDFEFPGDAGADNVYDVIVQVSDGTNVDTQAIAVTITNVDEAPSITSNGAGATASVSVAENGASVTTVTAADPDAATALAYTLVGGADQARFAIDAATGALTFVSAPDFEAPGDGGADNVYDVIVQVSDGTNVDTQAIAVAVTNVDEAPVITSLGAAPSARVSVAENSTAITTITATDPDAGALLVYRVVGGADAVRFTIDATTGALAFVAAPDFDIAADADADGTYDVVVQVSDGANVDTQAIAVAVTNVDEAPTITSDGAGATASLSAVENGSAVTTVAAVDPDAGSTLAYAIAGGADASRFAIDAATGVLTFVVAPDFEAPRDADADNAYEVVVQVHDGTHVDTQALVVRITNANEAPAITSSGGGSAAGLMVAENVAAVATVTATDPDAATTLAYAIVGGADAARFVIDPATGVLAFANAPDFDAPADADGDNVYAVVVQVSDGERTATQSIAVTIADVDEAPVITSHGGAAAATGTTVENTTGVATFQARDPDAATRLVWSIAGGADASRFAIDAAAGTLVFADAPDFERPGDADGDNVYEVVVRVDDGANSAVQLLAVAVRDANEAPTFVAPAAGAVPLALPENTVDVTRLAAVDPDAASILTYAIVGGADAAHFAVDPRSGALTLASAADFEAAGDADHDHRYDVDVAVSDGALASVLRLVVQVTDVNEAPTLQLPGEVVFPAHARIGQTLAQAVAHDPDTGDVVTYSLRDPGVGNPFQVDPVTGDIRLVGADLQAGSANWTLHVVATDSAGASVERQVVLSMLRMAVLDPVAAPVAIEPIGPATPVESAGTVAWEAAPPVTREIEVGTSAEPGGLGGFPIAVPDLDADAATRFLAASPRGRGGGASAALPGSITTAPGIADGLAVDGWAESFSLAADELRRLMQGRATSGADIARTAPTDVSMASVQDRDAGIRIETVRAPAVTGLAITAGFVWWITRASGLLATTLMGLPAWRHIDLLPIVAARRDEDDDELSGAVDGGRHGAREPDHEAAAGGPQRPGVVPGSPAHPETELAEHVFDLPQ